MYNEALAFSTPEYTVIIGFAGNLTVVVRAKHPDDVEVYETEATRAVRSWQERTGLTFWDAKTKAVLITDHRKKNIVKVEANQTVAWKTAIKYLFVMIDAKHIKRQLVALRHSKKCC